MSPVAAATPLSIPVSETAGAVSGLLCLPDGARVLYVLAHGAGAGMRHPFMERISLVLAQRNVATLRFQFLYMEKQQRRPDPPAVAVAAVRAAVTAAGQAAPGLPLVAGGKSFGGRMTSTAQAAAPLPGVRGLVFLGFPLHPPGNPGVTRAEHLKDVQVPMLFLQGDRDEFAEPILLRQVLRGLGAGATLHIVKDGDHSFNVPKRSGRGPDDVAAELADTLLQWWESIQ
ncbi:MAG TPA: alpha/beta family hydrolase [Gemmatimonadales bacterium]|nr:alpha/beta family hydrolase [Gemmatimonadales bacterium]